MRTVVILIFGALVLALGGILEIASFDSAFQRSGAVLISVVVLFLLFEINRISEMETKRRLETEATMPVHFVEFVKGGKVVRSLRQIKLDGGHASDRVGTGEERRTRTISIEDQVAEIKRIAGAERNVRVAEAFLLVVGTLVWGLGDLAANKMVHCGEWICSY
jgi:hypothetical protein